MLNEVKVDFGVYEERELSEAEVRKMSETVKRGKAKRGKKRVGVVLAAAAVAVCATAIAANPNGIIKSVTTGYNTYFQTRNDELIELPTELGGKLFDKNGMAYERITEDELLNRSYAEDGHKLSESELKAMLGVLADKDDSELEAHKYDYADIDEARSKASFAVKTVKLPSEYRLRRVYGFKDENGEVSGDYVNMEYEDKKGNTVYVMERLLNEATKFTASTDGRLEETELNGNKAVIMNGEIDIETKDSVSVSIMGKKLSRGELIEAAKSVSK